MSDRMQRERALALDFRMQRERHLSVANDRIRALEAERDALHERAMTEAVLSRSADVLLDITWRYTADLKAEAADLRANLAKLERMHECPECSVPCLHDG